MKICSLSAFPVREVRNAVYSARELGVELTVVSFRLPATSLKTLEVKSQPKP